MNVELKFCIKNKFTEQLLFGVGGDGTRRSNANQHLILQLRCSVKPISEVSSEFFFLFFNSVATNTHISWPNTTQAILHKCFSLKHFFVTENNGSAEEKFSCFFNWSNGSHDNLFSLKHLQDKSKFVLHKKDIMSAIKKLQTHLQKHIFFALSARGLSLV